MPLLIRATLDLDIALRTKKRLPFVPGAEIRMWAAPDEMHRRAAMVAGWPVVRTKVAGLLCFGSSGGLQEWHMRNPTMTEGFPKNCPEAPE
jgi:hypothetical protein